MKKTISFIMSLMLLSAVIYPCKSIITEKAELNNVLSVSHDIVEMCAEYDDYSELDDTDDKTIDTRLIVKTDDAIDEYGAIDSVYGFGYAFLQYADKESAQAAKEQYENSGCIVDFDAIITPTWTYDYSNWSDEWAYEETDAVSAIDYYKLKAKPNINIAVLDSGINYNHELFRNRLSRIKVDFSTKNKDDEMDTHGHGTRAAGEIVKSTPSNVKISAYRFFDRNGKGTSSESLAALAYIKQLNNKPDIISCSFHSPSGLSSMIYELTEMGVTFVAAAGNETEQTTTEFAKFDDTIVVSAFDYYGKPCSFTNYGAEVAISAPGEHIYTADIGGNNKYTFFNGTSSATPIVSAACAYVLMEHKDYTPAQIKQELMATATPFKKGDCYNDRYGAGIVNFSNIINGTRCKNVTANYISGAYRNNISVELKCANTLVDIYYTTDGTMPTKTNGTKYTEPFDINESARVIAAAYARAGTPMHSKFTYLDYYILNDDESEYVIDNDGKIKAYLGNEANLVVPETVNGIVPTKLGENIFKNSNIESIILPDTVTSIGNNAFYNTGLKSITANGVRYLNERCFYGCEQLAEINFPDLREIGTEALFDCKLLTQDLELPFVNWVCNIHLNHTKAIWM